MASITLVYIFYLLIQNAASDTSHQQAQFQPHSDLERDNSFDIFIFTLHWPYTTCYDWMESGKQHKCRDIGSIVD